MFTVTINGNTLNDLFANLETLLQSRPAANNMPPVQTLPPAPVVPVAPANPTTAGVAPAPIAPVATAPPAPTFPAPLNPAVPQAQAPAYDLEQLAKAGADLAQNGKMNECLALLAKYNVQTVQQLPPEQYGNFATDLRALGAQI